MLIDAPPVECVQYYDAQYEVNAFDPYLKLLNRYPKLKRIGDLNDHTKGTYEVIYDPAKIKEVQEKCYQRLYNKLIAKGHAQIEASKLASEYSCVGIICEDPFWYWIRDAVISPASHEHTYNRIVWKSDLNKTGGVATLPIISTKDGTKVVVILAFRHATNSWEVEIPRGGVDQGELPIHAAAREVKEETGYIVSDLKPIGSIAPDTGVIASIVPIFLGKVTGKTEAKPDKTEAIKGTYELSYQELTEGVKKGYLDLEVDGKTAQFPIRDPFLSHALLLAYLNHIFD